MTRVNATPNHENRGVQRTQVNFGLGVTALAATLLAFALWRVLQVIYGDPRALFQIGVALLGLPAGATSSRRLVERLNPARAGAIFAELGRLMFLNCVTVVLLLWFVVSRHGDGGSFTSSLTAVACAVPFFFAGSVLAMAIRQAAERTGPAMLYALSGVGVGLVLLIPFLPLLGAPNTMMAGGITFGIASAIWFNRGGEDKLRALAVLIALLGVALMGANGLNHIFEVRWSQGEQLPSGSVRWNLF